MLDDEKIRKKFEESAYIVPSSYEKKTKDTIEQIQKKNVKEIQMRGKHWWLEKKLAGAVILLVAVSLLSISSYAAVNLLRERLRVMPEDVVKHYNDDVQNSSADADSFSRELSEKEEERMAKLRVAYEEKGRFPQKTILEITEGEVVQKEMLCFEPSESKFYLPTRELTDEELLQIIDIQEKREYSVQQQSKQAEKETKSTVKISKQQEEDYALKAVQSLYGREKTEFEKISVTKQEELDEVVMQGKKEAFTVFITEENLVERVMYSVDGSSAHQTDVDFSEAQMREVSTVMQKKVSTFTGKTIRSEKIYYQANEEGKLAFGTVGYYYKLADGSGCVAIYSTNYGEMYDIYVMDDYHSIEKEIKRKKERAKKQGWSMRKVSK